MGFFSNLFESLFKPNNHPIRRTANITVPTTQSREYTQIVRAAKAMKTDLVEMSEHHPTCAICAIYQGRVYSVSGRDRRFPPLPPQIVEFGCIHEDCRHDFYPFIYGTSRSAYGHRDIIRFSNRPFADDRPLAEKQEWDRLEREAQQMQKDRADFEWVCKNLPDVAPKSFGGYRKMRSTNSANFKKVVASAKEKGYVI